MERAEGILPDPEKVEVVEDVLRPRNLREVREYMSFIGYYRRHEN